MTGYFAQASDAVAIANGTSVTPAVTSKLLGVDVFLAADAATQQAALDQASDEVDRGMRFQGRKCIFDQPREFPRAAYDSSRRFLTGIGPIGPAGFGVGDIVWDLDPNDPRNAIVPTIVLQAVIIQADSILRANRAQRLDAQHDGVKDAMNAGMRETYDEKAPGVQTGLCRRAYLLLERYEIKQGRMV